MIKFSDALPIQFWNYGIPTFNQKEEAGIDHQCYFHKINLEDTCTLQFYDTDTDKNYSLQIRDKDGEEIVLVEFNKEIIYSGVAVYYLEFLFSDHIPSAQLVEFWIRQTEDLSNIIGVSDLHDAQEFHDDTRLIKYSNVNDYVYITYVGVDPVPVFQIRVYSKFYEPRYPEENESEKLGDGSIVKLSSSVSSQKLFEVEPVPPYMNKKIKLALQHNTIEIENQAWEKEENYDTEKIADRYPFFKGKAFLTLKDDEYITNV